MESTAGPVAILALADGSVFRGISIGAHGHCTGTAVFNTALSGQQEILTDPASRGNIVAFTYPHIGNTGVNPQDMESERIQVAGLVVRDCPRHASNFRATHTLPQALRDHGVVAIADIDTRRLTRLLREKGSQGACILVGEDAQKAVALARDAAAAAPQPLPPRDIPQPWTQTVWQPGQGFGEATEVRHHVVVLDLGVKYAVLRQLATAGCRLSIVPATTSADQILAQAPDGVVVAGGPGDPRRMDDALACMRALLDSGGPLLGLGLGMSLMALSLAADVRLLSPGRHGANYPVQALADGRIYISSQSQAYRLDADALPPQVTVTHRCLLDGSVQALRLGDRPAIGVQAQAEGGSGPRDLTFFFDQFIQLMAARG